MDDNKEIILSTINETKKEVESFKKKLIAKSNQLPDVAAIKKSLSDIQKVITEIKNLCDGEAGTLKTISKNLSNAQISELLNKTELMFEVINDNLLNGMILKSLVNIDISEIEKKKEIWYENKKVGSITILDEVEDTLYIEVLINNCMDKFEVIKPYKMYHIISYINTKFNYE